jgi:predicted alpha/beta hydrolase family esterase
VAHSFASLALVHWLGLAPAQARDAISSAWLVAPANPARFGIDRQLHRQGLGIPTQLLGSENDPWMPLDVAREWAQAWGSRFLNLGPVGHINVESGHGAWPWMRLKVDQCLRDQQRELRLQRAHPMELSYAW